jgi:hypothetical protein
MAVWLVSLGVLLSNCTTREDPASVSPTHQDKSRAIAPASQVLLGNFDVQFIDRVFVDNQTTFSYLVSGTGSGPSLNHFTLEIPSCLPPLASYSPTNGVVIGTDPTTGITGIRWDSSLLPDESRIYSITFPGDVPKGRVDAAIKAGDDPVIGVVPGPCCAGFVISGTVYVDADSSGSRDVGESGIADVTITLVDPDASEKTTTTDSLGAFSFRRCDGDYTIRIDLATPEDDFNDDLGEDFDPTGPNSLIVTVGPDSPNNDFGFKPRTEEIIQDLEVGALQTDGQDVKFWTKQVRWALHGGIGNPDFGLSAMDSFVTAIQQLAIPSPYQFTPGNEYREALEILTTRSKDPVDLLLQQLLATEFNHVAGKGLLAQSDLQLVLIAWGEAIISAGLPASPGAASGRTGGIALAFGTGDFDKAIQLFELMNGGGGGGGGQD